MILTKTNTGSAAEPILLALGRVAQQQAMSINVNKTLAERLAEIDLEAKEQALLEEPERWDGMA